ncbi:uncharacterized protein LOC130370403 [Gadus chalcogrammus]|uniref:uncharacterized protein LOC130370403 n=1 Tax=Gadus chalcogrammus TaxID=1042646 RepID=UPI0024C4D6D9|nr:uncharacterized protein LOC130370403 [Gadus chalcogrammus]
MAENVRSPFDYREPPTLDSDGDGSKPPPPRGRVCGRKRKGTPVKVCDRAYVTEDEEEESMSEHSYSPGDGQYPEGAEDRLPPPGSPYYLADPSQLCVPELGEDGSSGVRGPVLFHPPPNCRIREVHCGSQVRLVVIAIRDIAKGEEITVDYSLTDWGENAMHCPYCGRHYRSLARHLEKHHAGQPEVRAAMELAHLHANGGGSHARAASSSTSSASAPCAAAAPHGHSFAVPQPSSSSNPTPPPLFSSSSSSSSSRERERESPATRSAGPAVSFSLSLSPPSLAPPPAAAAGSRKGGGPTAPAAKRGAGACQAASRVKSPSPPPPPAAPPPQVAPPPPAPASSPPAPRRGQRMKREKQEEQQKVEKEELAPPPTPEPHLDQEEELELSAEGEEEEEDAPEETNGELLSAHRQHISPLLSSLSCLVLYLRRQQHASFLSLTRSPHSAEAWRLLCHSSLSLLILYNRHRECEVAKLSLQDYRNRTLPPPPPPPPAPAGSGPAPPPPAPPTGTEALLSPFERHVLCHLPRAGVVGKRGRVQPLILPPHSEACLELLLQTSPNVGVDPGSPYVFSRPYHSPATPLRGTDLLRNLARASGAKNPGALTGTRVRRQVAILSQLLLLEEGGEGPAGAGAAAAAGGAPAPAGRATQRLEEFLEREYHVTQNCATIVRDPALMGRVGRVVLYGEREGVLFRGMSLQHICLELDVMSGNSGDSFSDDSDGEGAEKEEVKVEVAVAKKKGPGRPPRKKRGPIATPVNTMLPVAHKRRCVQPKSGKRGVLKRPWSEAERVAVETHLKRNIVELRVPAKADCERCLELCPLLVSNHRDWRSIKFYVHNRIQLLKKQGRRESSGGGAAC